MADPSDYSYNQNLQGQDRYASRDDLAMSAQANANYFYQMSWWWWNTYNWHVRCNSSNWMNQYSEQDCECANRNLTNEDDYQCCQNRNSGDLQTEELSKCKYCPEFYHTQAHDQQQERLLTETSNFDGNYSGVMYNDETVINGGDDDVDDDNDDDDDMRMEVDESFKHFLEQSEKHRRERERRKREVLEEKDDYIEVGSIHRSTTTCPPSEQPGAKRKEEMKLLYGKQASLMMSLEASLQLNYDKSCDIKQPIFWPSIPLKF